MKAGYQHKVLIIDDELEHSRFIEEILPEGFRAIIATNGEDGVRLARQESPTVILLDIAMPKMDGLATCMALRNNQATRDIPIIMLTAANDSENKTKAFSQGADDFVTKPIRVKELVARILSKVRRVEERNNITERLHCGNMTLDFGKIEVRIDDEVIPMSVLEFNILSYFAKNLDRVVSRSQLLEAIWRDSVVSARTVDTHIVSLRKKINDSDYTLKTVYGAGYVMKTKESEVRFRRSEPALCESPAF